MILRLYLPIEIIRNLNWEANPPKILPHHSILYINGNTRNSWRHQELKTIPRFHGEAPIKPQVMPCNSFIMNLFQVRPSRLALCCHVMCRCACWMLSKNLCNLVLCLSPFVVWIKQPVLSTESFRCLQKKRKVYTFLDLDGDTMTGKTPINTAPSKRCPKNS